MKRAPIALFGVAMVLAACGGNTGATNLPLKSSEADAMGGSDKVVQLAGTLGTESLAYNLQGVSDGQLKLTPDTIAGIFLGKIKKWNDRALTADNSGVSLPNQDIRVVHRSDGSGTTYIFTDYLSSVSPEWSSKVGKGKSVSWPAGQGASGNAAVATTIKQTPGAIGYVELAYVLQTNMTQARLKNKDGSFVLPSAAGATAAAKQFASASPGQFSIVNAPAAAHFWRSAVPGDRLCRRCPDHRGRGHLRHRPLHPCASRHHEIRARLFREPNVGPGERPVRRAAGALWHARHLGDRAGGRLSDRHGGGPVPGRGRSNEFAAWPAVLRDRTPRRHPQRRHRVMGVLHPDPADARQRRSIPGAHAGLPTVFPGDGQRVRLPDGRGGAGHHGAAHHDCTFP